MSNHERWVVYPLLFLSLGLSLRNVMVQQQQEKSLDTQLVRSKIVDTNVVQCRLLEVASSQGDRALYIAHEGSDVSIIEGQLEEDKFIPLNRGRIIWQPLQPRPQQPPADKQETGSRKTPDQEAADPETKKTPKTDEPEKTESTEAA